MSRLDLDINVASGKGHAVMTSHLKDLGKFSRFYDHSWTNYSLAAISLNT